MARPKTMPIRMTGRKLMMGPVCCTPSRSAAQPAGASLPSLGMPRCRSRAGWRRHRGTRRPAAARQPSGGPDPCVVDKLSSVRSCGRKHRAEDRFGAGRDVGGDDRRRQRRGIGLGPGTRGQARARCLVTESRANADNSRMSSEGAGVRVRADPPSPRPVALFGSFRHGQYYEDILAGVVAAADVAGGSVIAVQASAGVLPSGSELDGQEAVSRAAWDHFDGAIVILQTLSLDYVAQLRAAGKFVIAIGQEPRGTEVAIEIDNAGGVREAVTHLAQHGHTAIGFLSPTWQVDTNERYAAYCRRMEQLGLTAQPLVGADLPPELSMDQQGYLAAQQFVADPPPCTAVLVGTDLIALGFIRGLREAHIKVPADLAVIGIDDVDEAAVS